MKNERVLTEKERQLVEREFKALSALLFGYHWENGWEAKVYLAIGGIRRPKVGAELNRRIREKFGKGIEVKLRKCRFPENELVELKPPKQRRQKVGNA